MDIIQNILSDKRSSSRIKSKSLLLLARCNCEKADEILESLKLCRAMDPETIDDVLLKVVDISEYKYIISGSQVPETVPQAINPLRRKIADTHSINVGPSQLKNSITGLNHSIKHMKFANGELSCYLFFLNHPLQCRVCGFRFAGDADGKTHLGLHLDEHSRRERLVLDTKAISQEYFLTFDQFLCKVNRIEFDEIKKEEQFILAQNAFCEICKEKIEMKWCDEKNNWVLIDFVTVGGKEEGFCHRKCII